MRQSPERDELARLERPVRVRALRQVGDGTRQFFARPLRERLSQDGDRAARRFYETEGDAKECRLAGAIGSDNSGHRARSEGGRDVRQYGAATIRRRDGMKFQRRRHASLRRRRMSQRKKGAPSIAVTTPRRSWPSGAINLTAMSAAVTSTAPPSADGRMSRDGS